MSKDYKLSLNDDTFNALKSDFDMMLRKTLSNMEQRDNEQAEITAKVKITLTKDTTPDLNVSTYEAVRDIVRPKFDHKVSAVMQYKDETSGTLGGNYELVWDSSIGDYVMREITNGQTSLFDQNEPKTQPVDVEYTVVDEGTKAIDGRKPLALPGPAEEEPPLSPFSFMLKFVGDTLRCVEYKGNYSVRNEDNIILLTTGTQSNLPMFRMPPEMLEPHVGHHIVCVTYGDDGPINVSVECEDCGECIFSLDNEDGVDGPDSAQGDDYRYTEPDEQEGGEADE